MENVKQVILYRRDLKMRKGKIAAQVAHASMKAILNVGAWESQPQPGESGTLVLKTPPAMTEWLQRRFTKVVLSVEDEDALIDAYGLAKEAGIPCAIITDSGKTEFGGKPTRTTVALGPALASEIDKISGKEGEVATKLA